MPKGQIDKQLISEQVGRILANPGFKNSTILSRFLQYVVEESLEGREQHIKEYTIGIHVLSRSADFNPQANGIVRIHAGRLRRAIDEYYHGPGRQDFLRIEIPKGNYVPKFTMQDPSSVKTGVNVIRTKLYEKRPVVAVIPFRNISRNTDREFLAEGLGEQLSSELTRFHELAVVSYFSSRQISSESLDFKESAKLLGASYIITGSIQSEGADLHINIQIIEGEKGQVLWAKLFEKNYSTSGLFEIQNEIVKSILTAIGGYYGIIFTDILKSSGSVPVQEMGTYTAIFLYYHFQKDWTAAELKKTIHALESAVKADPDYALAWAMLGDLYATDKAMQLNHVENAINLALQCAHRSIQIDPGCQHGYASLAWIYLFQHNREDCVEAAEKCIALNPNSTDMTGAMGFVLSCAGDFDRGFELLNDSHQHNPFCPWWFNLGYVFYFISKRNYRKALNWAKKLDKPALFWDPMLQASILGHLNSLEEGSKYRKQFNDLIPDAGNHLEELLAIFLIPQDLREHIVDGLRKYKPQPDSHI